MNRRITARFVEGNLPNGTPLSAGSNFLIRLGYLLTAAAATILLQSCSAVGQSHDYDLFAAVLQTGSGPKFKAFGNYGPVGDESAATAQIYTGELPQSGRVSSLNKAQASNR